MMPTLYTENKNILIVFQSKDLSSSTKRYSTILYTGNFTIPTNFFSKIKSDLVTKGLFLAAFNIDHKNVSLNDINTHLLDLDIPIFGAAFFGPLFICIGRRLPENDARVWRANWFSALKGFNKWILVDGRCMEPTVCSGEHVFVNMNKRPNVGQIALIQGNPTIIHRIYFCIKIAGIKYFLQSGEKFYFSPVIETLILGSSIIKRSKKNTTHQLPIVHKNVLFFRLLKRLLLSSASLIKKIHPKTVLGMM
jgi:hypothetical protein